MSELFSSESESLSHLTAPAPLARHQPATRLGALDAELERLVAINTRGGRRRRGACASAGSAFALSQPCGRRHCLRRGLARPAAVQAAAAAAAGPQGRPLGWSWSALMEGWKHGSRCFLLPLPRPPLRPPDLERENSFFLNTRARASRGRIHEFKILALNTYNTEFFFAPRGIQHLG